MKFGDWRFSLLGLLSLGISKFGDREFALGDDYWSCTLEFKDSEFGIGDLSLEIYWWRKRKIKKE